jgi:hypothetical protein
MAQIEADGSGSGRLVCHQREVESWRKGGFSQVSRFIQEVLKAHLPTWLGAGCAGQKQQAEHSWEDKTEDYRHQQFFPVSPDLHMRSP